MYNKNVEDCFFHPNHIGVMDLSDLYTVHCRHENPGQVVLVDFYLQCTQDRIISRACFKASGNPYVIAALEWLCRLTEGRQLDEVAPIDYKTLVNELEIPHAQYPLALQIGTVYKDLLALMKKKFEGIES
jgi:nitrogen fixation NifU-like protein